MFDFDASCPHCEKKFKLNRIGLDAKEFIQCPHCRRIIKLDLADPEKKAIRISPDFADWFLVSNRYSLPMEVNPSTPRLKGWGLGAVERVKKGDAMEMGIFNESNLPDEIAFDHRSILSDYFKRAFWIALLLGFWYIRSAWLEPIFSKRIGLFVCLTNWHNLIEFRFPKRE